MNSFAQVLKFLEKARHLGSVEQDGVQLIGHVPHVAPEAYLHLVFPGLNDKEVEQLDVEIRRRLPAWLRDFYRRANGIDMFSGTLSIHGLRRYLIDDNGAPQPFSLSLINVDERVPGAPDDCIFFATYGFDGSLLCTLGKGNQVYRTGRETFEILNRWKTFSSAIIEETERISNLFNNNGELKHPDAPTTPES